MTTRSRSTWIASGVLFAALTVSLAAAAMSQTGESGAGFHVNGPAGLSVDGTSDDVYMADDGTVISVKVGLTKLKTGIFMRDRHAKAALGTDRFPEAELKVAVSALKFPPPRGESSGDAPGTLTLHGQTKDVSVHYAAKYEGDTMNVTGGAHINLRDFGITAPSYVGFTAKPEIEITGASRSRTTEPARRPPRRRQEREKSPRARAHTTMNGPRTRASRSRARGILGDGAHAGATASAHCS